MRSTPNPRCRTHATIELVPHLIHLVQHSLAPTTIRGYQHSLSSFQSFLTHYHVAHHLPVPPIFVALFVAYLHKKNLAYRTIVSTLSAISYIHRCHDLPEPNDNFLVKNSLRGIKNLGTVPDARMPVSLDLLDKLCASVQHVCTSPWIQILFQSMYLLAFFAFIRVGEMTLSHGRIQNVLQFSNVLF